MKNKIIIENQQSSYYGFAKLQTGYEKDGQFILHSFNDEPAVVSVGGYEKYWLEDGLLHRENGPAITKACISGDDKYYYQANVLHREDGPAMEFTNGAKQYWKHGKLIKKEWEGVPWYK